MRNLKILWQKIIFAENIEKSTHMWKINGYTNTLVIVKIRV